MNPSEEKKGTGVPPAGSPSAGEGSLHTAEPSYEYDDGYPHEPPVSSEPEAVSKSEPVVSKEVAVTPRPAGGGRKPPPPPPPTDSGGGGDDEEDRMLRMSFLEHLEELRNRI